MDRIASKIFGVILLVLCSALVAYAYTSKTNTTNAGEKHLSQSLKSQYFWLELRSSFKLNHHADNASVRRQIETYRHNPDYLNKTLTKATPYLYYILQQTIKRNLPGELVLLPVLESAYDPFAYSNRGAAGLWQIMPSTGSGFGLKENWWYNGRRDISASTRAALEYFAYLKNYFNQNWLLAIAAYDSGEGTVQNAIGYGRGTDADFWNLPLPRETQAYVPRLLALAEIIANPRHYGIKLPDIKSGPYFVAVNLSTQIELAHAAQLAEISLQEMYRLNPGYNRWATDPNGPHRLLLPVEKIEKFRQNLETSPIMIAKRKVETNRNKIMKTTV